MGLLKLEGLTKIYGTTVVVDDFSLEVAQGEFISLLGPSGCGKTTTLQMIAGFTRASAGTISLFGRDISADPPAKRGFGVVFQSYALFPHMTVAENVSFGLEMRKVSRTDRDAAIDRALNMVRLDRHALRYPRELSGGQRQRVALARAIVVKPDLLLLDEPLSNLDANLREEMQYELREIQSTTGTTTIMVTHDQSEALSMSDRVVVMNAGKIRQVDMPHALYERPVNEFVSNFVGTSNLIDGDAGLTREEVSAYAVTPGPGAIRPEKISLTRDGPARRQGKVASRYFLGDRWLYRVRTEQGELLVCRPNDGINRHEVGEDVNLWWRAEDLRWLAREQSV